MVYTLTFADRVGGGYSEQVTDYMLIQESITPLTKPSTNYLSPKYAENIIHAYGGHT